MLVRQGKLTAENANVALDAGMPPLHLAISRGHIDVAELLLDLMCSDNTIDINCRDASGLTPLHHALQVLLMAAFLVCSVTPYRDVMYRCRALFWRRVLIVMQKTQTGDHP